MDFRIVRLASSVPNFAPNFDGNIINPWGILNVGSIIWVANTGSGLITHYNEEGRPQNPPINVFGPHNNNISSPTGIVINENSQAFNLYSGTSVWPSNIIVATRDGTICGYNKNIDLYNAPIVIDNSATNAVYTGLALANSTLYAADFYNQKIAVFNSSFKPITTYPFVDQFSGNPIPSDYAPNNIIKIGEQLFVTYAKQSPQNSQFEEIGTGFGYVSIFSLTGLFIRRFASNGVLNVPWGLVLSPDRYGYPANTILISNYGDGTINAFDSEGMFLGKMTNGAGVDLHIDGLRGLTINVEKQVYRRNRRRLEYHHPTEQNVYWSESIDNRQYGAIGLLDTKQLNQCNNY